MTSNITWLFFVKYCVKCLSNTRKAHDKSGSHYYTKSSLEICRWKNFQIRLIFTKVMTKKQSGYFSEYGVLFFRNLRSRCIFEITLYEICKTTSIALRYCCCCWLAAAAAAAGGGGGAWAWWVTVVGGFIEAWLINDLCRTFSHLSRQTASESPARSTTAVHCTAAAPLLAR